jgi:RNA polymerase sigma factor (sigma-70 family)
LSDAQLLERFVRSRDEAAFEVLVWRHGGLVLGVCQRILRHEQDVEDAFQAAFLTLARKAGSIGKRAAVASWLYKVAYRVALAARTVRLRQAHREQPWFDLPGTPTGDDPAWRELGPVLDDEVSRLPEKYRSAFVLCCLQGKTNEEAARHLGCPKGTVLSRLARARQQLRRRLTRRGLGLAGTLAATFTAQWGLAAVPAGLVTTTLKTAQAGATGPMALAAVSGRVAILTEGVMRAMFMTKLKHSLLGACALALLAAGVGIVGLGSPGSRADSDRVATQEDRKAEEGKPAPSADADEIFKQINRRKVSQNNLRNIGIAMHSYHDALGHMPTPAIYSQEGKSLLSWRVSLLPYLDEQKLYKRFKLNEPWDSAHNKALLKEMPRVYAPVTGKPKPGHTYYQVFVGPGAAFEERQAMRIPASFTDGTSMTILVVEAGSPVPWTKPEDLPFNPNKPLPKLGGMFHGDFNALLADASVNFLSRKADADMLRAAITRAGGEPVDFAKIQAREAGFGDEELPDIKAVEKANTRLRSYLKTTLAQVDQLRRDLEILQWRARGVKDVDAKSLKLLREHEELRKAFEKALHELEELKQQKARLEDQLKRER